MWMLRCLNKNVDRRYPQISHCLSSGLAYFASLLFWDCCLHKNAPPTTLTFHSKTRSFIIQIGCEKQNHGTLRVRSSPLFNTGSLTTRILLTNSSSTLRPFIHSLSIPVYYKHVCVERKHIAGIPACTSGDSQTVRNVSWRHGCHWEKWNKVARFKTYCCAFCLMCTSEKSLQY